MTAQAVASKLPRYPGAVRTIAAVLVVDALIVGWVLFAGSGRASDGTVRVVDTVLTLIALGGVTANLLLSRGPGPARLVPRQDRLVAPRSRRTAVLESGILWIIAWPGAGLDTEFWSREWAVQQVIGLVVAALFVAQQLLSAAVGSGSIELDPSHVRLVYQLGWVAVPWPAVDGEIDGSGWRARTLRVTAPEQVTRHGLARRRTDLPHASVDRTFLAAVIKYYVAHPEHRQEIGTQAGYDRVLRDIGSQPPV